MTEPRGRLLIRVLGPIEVTGSAETLTPKQKLLLAALALRPGVVATDLLAELLWPDDRPENPRAALQVHVSKLRRVLRTVEASVRHEGGGYLLVADRRQVDVSVFERLTDAGAALVAEDPARARELLAEALTLWQGDPLEGLGHDSPLDGDIRRLENMRLEAVSARIDCELSLDLAAQTLTELRRLTHEHPLHEGFWRQLMLALYRAGRAGEALASFEDARQALSEELGTDPGPELADLHRRILQQDPTLDGRPASAASPRVAPPPDPLSLAVLPFEVLGPHPTGGADAELLADGLHTDLLVELARVPGLTVISRPSVLAYEPADLPAHRIARELGVANLLVGGIQVSGERFRLSVQLIDALGDTHRWAESYDQVLSTGQLLNVQQDLAQDIAAALTLELTPGTTTRSHDTTHSLEAYRLVVEARMQFDRKTEEGLVSAIELFGRAVRLDDDYVQAWLGLAEALALTADYGYGDRAELLARAEEAVARVEELDPRSPYACVPRGLIAEGRFDATSALSEYRTAVTRIPGHADARSWFAWVSLTVGDAAAALASVERAVRLNPLSAEAVSNWSLAQIAVGDPTTGLDEAERSLMLSPGYTTGMYYQGLALDDLGRFDDSAATLEPLARAVNDEAAVPWAGMAPDAALALAHVARGAPEPARRVLSSIDPGTYPVEAGLVLLALGDTDEAAQLFSGPVPAGYGSAMLFHLHFRDVWAELGDAGIRGRLARSIARAWNAEGLTRAG